MTSYPLPRFPDLPALNWPVKRIPRAGLTRSAQAVSGRVARLALWANPLFDFELIFEGLVSNSAHPGLWAYSEQMLEGFLLEMQGAYGVFAFESKPDSYQAGAPLGIGDSLTTTFTPSRTIGPYNGPPDYIFNVETIYANGVALAGTAWSLQYPNQIVFGTPPSSGTVLTIDFWWAYAVTFSEDMLEISEFMSNLHSVGSLKLRGVRLS